MKGLKFKLSIVLGPEYYFTESNKTKIQVTVFLSPFHPLSFVSLSSLVSILSFFSSSVTEVYQKESKSKSKSSEKKKKKNKNKNKNLREM